MYKEKAYIKKKKRLNKKFFCKGCDFLKEPYWLCIKIKLL